MEGGEWGQCKHDIAIHSQTGLYSHNQPGILCWGFVSSWPDMHNLDFSVTAVTQYQDIATILQISLTLSLIFWPYNISCKVLTEFEPDMNLLTAKSGIYFQNYTNYSPELKADLSASGVCRAGPQSQSKYQISQQSSLLGWSNFSPEEPAAQGWRKASCSVTVTEQNQI